MPGVARFIHFGAAFFATLSLTVSVPAHAQGAAGDYPSKPINFVVPFDAGGPQDTALRNYAGSIQKSTGAQFVILNRLGAGTTVGSASVARAAPDGYTILSASPAFAISPSMYTNLTFDNVRDFEPISLLEEQGYLFVVHASAPFKTLRDYIEYARTHPGELNYSTGGVGGATHFPGELLHYMTKTKVTFVHYKSPAQRLIDLVAGRVHVSVGSAFNVMPQVKAGKLRPLAATTRKRLPVFPDIPTAEEAGVKGFEYSAWMGVLAPASTPPAVVNKLNALFLAAQKDPIVTKKAEGDGIMLVGSSPAEFRQFVTRETSKWRELIKATNMELQTD